MRHSREFTRGILSLALAAAIASGCSSWRTQEVPSTSLTKGQRRLADVRLLLTDGRTVKADRAEIIGDSLIAYQSGRRRLGTWFPPVRTAFPMSDVQAIEHREISAGKTLLLTGGILVVGLGVAAIVILHDLEKNGLGF